MNRSPGPRKTVPSSTGLSAFYVSSRALRSRPVNTPSASATDLSSRFGRGVASVERARDPSRQENTAALAEMAGLGTMHDTRPRLGGQRQAGGAHLAA